MPRNHDRGRGRARVTPLQEVLKKSGIRDLTKPFPAKGPKGRPLQFLRPKIRCAVESQRGPFCDFHTVHIKNEGGVTSRNCLVKLIETRQENNVPVKIESNLKSSVLEPGESEKITLQLPSNTSSFIIKAFDPIHDPVSRTEVNLYELPFMFQAFKHKPVSYVAISDGNMFMGSIGAITKQNNDAYDEFLNPASQWPVDTSAEDHFLTLNGWVKQATDVKVHFHFSNSATEEIVRSLKELKLLSRGDKWQYLSCPVPLPSEYLHKIAGIKVEIVGPDGITQYSSFMCILSHRQIYSRPHFGGLIIYQQIPQTI